MKVLHSHLCVTAQVMTSAKKHGWLAMMRDYNATTTMECWSPDELPNLSFSHIWSASPTFVIPWYRLRTYVYGTIRLFICAYMLHILTVHTYPTVHTSHPVHTIIRIDTLRTRTYRTTGTEQVPRGRSSTKPGLQHARDKATAGSLSLSLSLSLARALSLFLARALTATFSQGRSRSSRW